MAYTTLCNDISHVRVFPEYSESYIQSRFRYVADSGGRYKPEYWSFLAFRMKTSRKAVIASEPTWKDLKYLNPIYVTQSELQERGFRVAKDSNGDYQIFSRWVVEVYFLDGGSFTKEFDTEAQAANWVNQKFGTFKYQLKDKQ